MKSSILVLAFLGSAAVACAAASEEAITLPEMRTTGEWEHPAVLQHVVPEYPYELRRAGEEGRVSCEMVVERDGRVKAISVLDSDNNALSQAAIEAARKWKFVPDGSTSEREHRIARITFSFVLEQPA